MRLDLVESLPNAAGITKVIMHPVVESGALQHLTSVHVANDKWCSTSSAAAHRATTLHYDWLFLP